MRILHRLRKFCFKARLKETHSSKQIVFLSEAIFSGVERPAFSTIERTRMGSVEAKPPLHFVAAHVFVVEALEPAAQLFGGRTIGRAGGVQLGQGHYLF